uniref:Golgi apparatus protein 1 n=1 Tax=Chlamydomonas euryale TaxID=1486919 RepID=A0A7R9V0N1_9CHLO
MSNIIPSAGEAELANGIGDLPPAGPCKADIKAFCSDVTPGEGRLSECLVERQREMRDGNTPGRKVTQKCIDDIVAFKIDRSSNINKDVPLARACKDDVAKWCQYANDKNAPGSTLACLRAKKNKMGAGCKKEIFRTQQDVVEDYRFDYKLYARCKADVSSLCPDVEPGSGGELDCLESKRQHVSWECQDQMFREEQETGDDIRLSVRLFNKCLQDYRRFCRKVPPGHMRVQECLEDNMDQAKFSPQCKEELDGILASRVADFRLDTALRDACETDVEATCGHSLESMDEDDKAGGTLTSTVLNCLQQYEDELKETECRAEVHRRKQRAARDIRLDEVLYEACSDDRTEFCADVKPGSARVIRCLQDHRSTLSQSCTAALFDHEVRMAEDIDFKYPMKKACAWEISAFCKDVPHGHARVVRCLTDNLDNTDMTSACKKQVERDQNMAARDYRLNFRLSAACGGDISRLCGDTCLQGGAAGSCGGVVLQCLQDNEDNVTDAACQEEIFYFELMEVRDFRNDVILAEACRNDVAQFCQDVEPGDGRVHKCLRGAMGQLSPRCRKEEQKLQAKEMRDVRLRPKLNRACSEEKAVYCKDVKPGRARVVQCLMENMAQPDFGQECLEELEKREDAVKNDYRMDVGVATNCEADVTTFCPDERSQLRGNATVLKCLVANFASLAEPCQAEMSRAVRVALWDYKPGAPLTQACDKDVSDKCPGSSQARVSGSPFTIGAVGRCLSKAVVQHSRLDAQCRALTLVAAPKDMRAMFDGSESSGALVARLADLQAAAGLDRVLVDPYGPNAVTVTGWVAIACIFSIVVVLLGSVFVLIRRLQGQRVAAYTQLAAKSGDV